MLNRGEPMAEHRIYLASCGVFLIAGSSLTVSGPGWPSSAGHADVVIVTGLVAIIATLSGRTLLRNALWGHPVLVWLDAAERAPTNWLPHRVLGEELHRAGKHAEAIAAFTRAIELGPAEVSTYGKLGVCLTEQGDLATAEAVFTKMQALDVRSPEASNGLATLALLHGNLEPLAAVTCRRSSSIRRISPLGEGWPSSRKRPAEILLRRCAGAGRSRASIRRRQVSMNASVETRRRAVAGSDNER